MRRIEFIAPVEAMRGNISGRQRLLYADNNNPAWDAPEGKHYARNYKPRYIGYKRSATGHTYFTTRTKHAINNTVASRTVQASMPAASALYDNVIHNLTWVAPLMNLYNLSAAHANGDSLYKWFCDTAVKAFKSKFVSVIYTEYDQQAGVMRRMRFSNPFVNGAGITEPNEFPEDFDPVVLDKFWDTLSPTGKRFTVESMQGIFFDDMNWENLVTAYGGTYNILGATLVEVGSTDYVKIGNMWLKYYAQGDDPDDAQYVTSDDNIQELGTYFLTAEAPTA